MWMSKGPSTESAPASNYMRRDGTGCVLKAHFVVDGHSLCTEQLAPFLCTWVELRAIDRKCGLCRRMVATIPSTKECAS